MAAKIDPRLRAALRGQGPVQAVVTLKSPLSGRPLEADQTEASVKQLLDDAARKTNSQPHGFVVFKNLQSFSIDAAPNLINEILQRPSIDSASYNGVSVSAPIQRAKTRRPRRAADARGDG